jgi:hypothetical protein
MLHWDTSLLARPGQSNCLQLHMHLRRAPPRCQRHALTNPAAAAQLATRVSAAVLLDVDVMQLRQLTWF